MGGNIEMKAIDAKNQNFVDLLRRRLSRIVSKRIQTVFIGAIAVFEEEFGFLWGHGLNEGELNENQKNMREIWMKARSRILNTGNNQMRIITNEIVKHFSNWKKYNITFKK